MADEWHQLHRVVMMNADTVMGWPSFLLGAWYMFSSSSFNDSWLTGQCVCEGVMQCSVDTNKISVIFSNIGVQILILSLLLCVNLKLSYKYYKNALPSAEQNASSCFHV
ncbi:uncharacterized protein EI97DRAFT_47670 [Westerdykella ornata]|uniref:Uncharacterized protein n=1 Tax=Westerdykella ornata TaxID=318751 RepID=A0A6A6JIM4_WESOR|nr:uncharacterized protein EI97DRAFT_47670 [Westerdykella ornata]KAF2276074.1 hypothetical protein EI97DRAFT_47670 [Westerdykella ornata]